MLTAHIIHEHPKETATYKCSLTYAERFLRRKRLETDCGISFVLDLEKTTNLNHGDHIELNDGTLVTVCLLYTSPSPRDLSTSRMPSSA